MTDLMTNGRTHLFILPPSSTKSVCFLCESTVALIKSQSIERQYEKRHRDFDRDCPPKSLMNVP